jgi:hypothetical protein
MAIFGAVNGLLNLETEAWTRGAKKAGEDIDALDKKTQGFFDTAKGFRSSEFGQSLRLLAGGGALGIVDRLVGDATKMVDTFSELSGKIDTGEASLADMEAELARQTPVLGTFVKFWDSVLGAVTGTTKALAEQDAYVKDQLASLERRTAIIRDGTAAEQEFTEELRKWSQQHIVESLGNGTSGAIGKAILAQTNEAKKVQDQYAAAMKKIMQDVAKGQPDLEQALKDNPSADLVPVMEKKMADLQSQQQAALNDLAKVKSNAPTHMWDWMGKIINTKETKAAEDQIKDVTDKIQALQSDIDSAKTHRDKLLDAGAKVLNNSFTDFATSIGSSITKPFSEAWKKAQELSDKVKAKLDQDAADNRSRLRDLGKELTDQALTPMQKILKEMKEIDVLQKVGTITDATHDALQKKYLKELESESKLPERKPLTAVENPFGRRSVNNDLSANTPINKLAATAEKQLEEQRKGLKLDDETIRKLKDGTQDIRMSF